MRKICRLLFVGAFVVITTVPAFAVEAPANTAAQKYFCLKADRTGGHVATLTLDPSKPQPAGGVKMYVMVKIDNKLTTGNPDLDADPKVFGNTQNYDALRTTLGFDNNGVPQAKPGLRYPNRQGAGVQAPGTNPVTDPSTLNVKWLDDLKVGPAYEHYWFGMQLINPGGGVNNGAAGGQQQGTFKWAISANNSDCAMIKWDPLGIVFDAQTLGVIPGAIVTIFDAGKTPAVKVPMGAGKGQVATNPFNTLENGSFSFFTDPGSYSMTIEGSYNGKPLVIAKSATVNPSYKMRGYVNLYNIFNDAKQPIIEEAGETVRTDIAVDTVGASPPPPLTPSFVGDPNLNPSGDMIQISGQVSGYTPEAPNVKVVVLYTVPKTMQTQESPLVIPLDAFGGYNFHAPQALESDPTYIIDRLDLRPIQSAQKTDIINRFMAKVSSIVNSLFMVHAAQSMSLNINPVPSYLEGIAKDTSGAVIPFASVGVYVQGSDVAAYQTKADINGYYVIGSQFIPPSSYEIRLTKVTGEVIKMSTKEYLAQNATYHKTNNINSFSTTTATTSIDSATNTLMVTKTVVPQDTGTTGSNNSTIGKSGQSSNPSGRTNAQTTQAQTVTNSGAGLGAGMQGIVMIGVVIMVLIILGVGAFVMMKSKQSQLPPQY